MSAAVRVFWSVAIAGGLGTAAVAGVAPLPTGWAAGDIGRVGTRGQTVAVNGQFVLIAAGAQIGGTSDSFHFVHRRLSGDGQIVARVATLQQPAGGTAAAGVMVRESLGATAREAALLLTGDGVLFAHRGSGGAAGSQSAARPAATPAAASARATIRSAPLPSSRSASTSKAASLTKQEAPANAVSVTAARAVQRPGPLSAEPQAEAVDVRAPYFVKLVRAGNTFSGYVSSNGTGWQLAGTQTIPMQRTVYVGLATTSGDPRTLATATFVDVVDGGAGSPKSNKQTLGKRAPVSVPAPAPVAAPAPAPAPVAPAPAPPTPAQAAPAPAPAAPAPAPAPAPPAPEPSATPASTSPGSGSVSTIRLLHWNTHHGGLGTDGVFDPDRLVSWVARMNPDVISFNEVDDEGQAEMLHALVNAYTGVSWTSTFSGWGNQVLTRFPVDATSVCVFNAGAGRRAAHLSIAVNGRALNVWSAHLAVDSSSTRIDEVYALQGCAQNWPEARIFAGDYNMQQSSTEYAAAVSAYADAWAAAKALGAAINYAGNCDGCTRNSRIDYVFSSQGASSFLSVKSVQIFDTRDGNGVMPSDHKPMVITYSIH